MTEPAPSISWAFSITRNGTVVIRNWYLLFGFLLMTCFGAVVFLAVMNEDGLDASLAGIIFCLYGLWSFYLEVLGVRFTGPTVAYPVRLGLGSGIFPLFRKSIAMQDVLQASSLKTAGIWIAYLSGEFGQAKILFDTKGGRDRFFAILTSRVPHIKIYRWT